MKNLPSKLGWACVKSKSLFESYKNAFQSQNECKKFMSSLRGIGKKLVKSAYEDRGAAEA